MSKRWKGYFNNQYFLKRFSCAALLRGCVFFAFDLWCILDIVWILESWSFLQAIWAVEAG